MSSKILKESVLYNYSAYALSKCICMLSCAPIICLYGIKVKLCPMLMCLMLINVGHQHLCHENIQ